MSSLRHSLRTITVLAAFASAGALAQDPAILEGNGITVTASDLVAESQRLPAESRSTLMSRQHNVERMASNIYTRRVLAAEAVAEGLDKDPLVARQLQLARDKVLSDARLARLEAQATPSEEAVFKYAQDMYRADPKRFAQPERWRARHILVRGANKEEAKAKAEAILAELKGGAKFEEVARARSEDPGSAARGGDLGFFGPGRMVKPFEEAVRKLQPGALSEVVETQFGYHIIRLEEARPAGVPPFEEIKDALVQQARAKIVQDAIAAKMEQINATGKLDKAAAEAFAASNASK